MSQTVDEAALVTALRAGDEVAFNELADRHRGELLLHCYRMLGSFQDAEDMLQETLLRAWRGLSSFEGRSAVRSWLYKIATNVSLDALASRKRRFLPSAIYSAGNPGEPLPAATLEQAWVEPIPDALIDSRPWVNPEAHYDARESVSLAFLATLQTLPSRQRAVLILRDVLGFGASEVADLLDSSVPSVNSALQRARVSMKAFRSDRRKPETEFVKTDQTATLLSRYVAAWQARDAGSLVALLREDVVFTMPPLPLWYRGRASLRWFLDQHLFSGEPPRRFRLVAARANGGPAFAAYERDDKGVYRLGALHVLSIEHDEIAEVHDFLVFDDQLFVRFGLPLVLTD
jgi:RNA polymerase sigma-70 factor (ECF subfamily)